MILRASGTDISLNGALGGRDVFARRELRVRVHPGQSRRARGLEPGGGDRRRRGRRRRRRSRWRAGCAGCSGRASASRFIRGARAPRRSTRPPPRPAAPPAPRQRRCSICRTTRRSACRRSRVSPGCRSRSACCAPRLRAGYTRLIVWLPEEAGHTEPGAWREGALRRTLKTARRQRHDRIDRAAVARGALGSRAGHDRDGDRRRHGRLARRCSRRRGRPDGRTRRACATCPPDRTGRESGAIRLTVERAGDPMRVASELARRRTQARALPSGTDVVQRRGAARAAHRRRRRISSPPSRRSGDPATRTPTPRSRASTAACRCRSASR